VDQSTRRELIERYRDGLRAVVAAVRQVGEQNLDVRLGPDQWTAREIAHHLADSEMTSALRLRRLIAEDRPVIQGYDEAEFARKLFYGDRPIEGSLDALKAARQTNADILDRLSEEQWAREGTHSESGHYSVETWLEIYAAHAHDHAAQVDEILRLIRSGGV
jgi:hypothetical protein